MQETLVRSLGWEDLLEKGTATHSSILAWRIPWTHGVAKSRTRWSDFHFSEIYIGQAGVRHLDVVVSQLLSHVQLFANPWTTACQASRALTISLSLLKLISIEFVMLSNHLILYHTLLVLPSIFPSIRVFSNESSLCIRWPKYWSFSFSISPANEYSVLISFRIDWFDLHAVQGTLKSLL